jgi:predicted enzyme related to lactoylglutathione lyase
MNKLIAFIAPALLGLLTSCTTLNLELPPVSDDPTGNRFPGRVIWHDLLTKDIDASRRFYGGLFGWEFEELPLTLGFGQSSRYLLIRHKGQLIGGMVDVSRVDKNVNSSQWVVVMSVQDVDAAATAIGQAGGSLITPPTDLNDRGRIAVVKDSAGALFAMLETRDGDPVERDAALGEFMWDEVWTNDIDEAAAFYQSVAPFKLVNQQLNNVDYKGLAINDKPRVGVLKNPLQEQGLQPTWVSYIRVADMTVLDQVPALGGEVLMGAQDRAIGGEVAIIRGPSGAGVALQTWGEFQEN